jgi:hypothetical protein
VHSFVELRSTKNYQASLCRLGHVLIRLNTWAETAAHVLTLHIAAAGADTDLHIER